jgi:hypothetical protein
MRSRFLTAQVALIAISLLGSSTAIAQPSALDASGYSWAPATYDFVSIAASGTEVSANWNGTAQSSGEEDVTIPFNFPFYGNVYTTASVGADGALAFTAGENIKGSNYTLPNTSTLAANVDIAVFWDDLRLGSTGGIYTLDDTANGRFIISWEDVCRNYSYCSLDFQVHLYADGSIQLHYQTTTVYSSIGELSTIYSLGASATVGIQDESGGTSSAGNASQISFNQPAILDGTAYAFTICGDADADGSFDTTCGGNDCDEANPAVGGNTAEICADGIDQDCTGYDLLTDLDGDGDYDPACGGADCDDLDASRNSTLDADGDTHISCDECDDSNADTYPGADELCDGEDNDCDGTSDDLDDTDGDGDTICNGDCDDTDAADNTLDADGDTFDTCSGDDCDDTNAAAYVGATEVCDSIDQDCDGAVDNVDDLDADGETVCAGDCDDDEASINTSATEICGDSIDNDCSGTADDLDADGDGHTTLDCGGDDCNDADAAVSPSATETCDGADLDSDCDGLADAIDLSINLGAPSQGTLTESFEANDGGFLSTADSGDTALWEYGAPTSGPGAANSPANVWATVLGGNYGVNYNDAYLTTPSYQLPTTGAEVSFWYWQANESSCNYDYTWLEIDDGAGFVMLDDGDSCSSGLANVSAWTQVTIDLSAYAGQAVTIRFWHDSDSSVSSYPGTYIDDFSITTLVSGTDDADSDGYVDSCGDCDGSDASLYPGATEICDDGIDQDCDLADTVGDVDTDGETSIACGGLDCDDTDSAIYTGATEACDGIDNNCSGTLDDAETDDDGDGSAACVDCDDADDTRFPGATEICGDSIDQDCDSADLLTDNDADGENCDTDCDDDDAAVNSSATEACDDAIDNDCDGTVDVIDADSDTFNACGAEDCDDTNAAINPDATETCDGADVDEDCDGIADSEDTDLLVITTVAIADEDFEANDGGFLSTAGTLSTAIWEYGAPTSGPGAGNSGSANVWATVLDGNYGVNYNDAYLTTPSYQIPATGAELSFWYWQNNESSCLFDYTKLQIDDGSGFALLADGDSCSVGLAEASSWTNVTIDLSAYAGQAVTIRFWHDSDSSASAYPGTYIDDFSITNSAIVGDDDNDGYVDSCGDCDGADASINPGAAEVCGDGIDQDCDLADLVTDLDSDGESDAACGGLDCDDNDASVFSTATEECDGFDNNCDGLGSDARPLASGALTNPQSGSFTGTGSGNVFDIYAKTDGAITGFEWLISSASTTVDIYWRLGSGVAVYTDPAEWTLLDQVSVSPATTGSTTIPISAPLYVSAGETYSLYFQSDASITYDYNGSRAIGDLSTEDDFLELRSGFAKRPSEPLFGPLTYPSSIAGATSSRGWLGTIQYSSASNEIDGDGDGYVGCTWVGTDPAISGGDDCDNTAAAINTAAVEACNGLDDDCNGSADFDASLELDLDGDSFISCDDCDDDTTTGLLVNPNATEVCDDGIDNDCDGSDTVSDADGDSAINIACGGDDCDDDATTGLLVNPSASEVCNDAIDNDCDPLTEDVADNDGDGVDCITDCDDANDWVFPGFFEWCGDGIDNDCDPATVDIGDQDGDGVACDSDCDDSNASIFPGATELLCTGLDEDCLFGPTDTSPDIDDGDGDSYNCDVDCDDSDPAVNPVALEIPCDGVDNDCDLEIDTDDGLNNDVDGDLSTCDADCDDNDDTRSPDFDEVCDDSIDNDCSPATDDIHDFDADGSLCTDDCDDDDELSYPGAPEICADGLDQDCDNSVDELADGAYDLDDDDSLLIGICSFSFPFCGTDWDTLWVQDDGRLTFAADDRTSTESVSTLVAEAPLLAALWTDLNPSSNGSVEVTETDEDSLEISFAAVPEFGVAGTANTFTLTLYPDGTASILYGDLSVSDGLVGFACGGTAVDSVDLSAYEVLAGTFGIGSGTEDGIYEQFSNLGSPNDLANEEIDLCLTAGVDADGDGWTDTCGDCDDAEATTYPGADELCDSTDNDCNGSADDVDLDGDTFIDESCGGDDCDDSNEAVNTAATEICNGIDDDCDGAAETGGTDADADGFLLCGDDADCDDTNSDINPDAEEICDALDNNCDGVIDEDFTSDLDEDGFLSEACGGDDCDDTRANTNPSAVEVCDLADNDCDETIDEVDVDEDTFIDANCGGDDCDDSDAEVNPGAEEVPYDGIDNDCEGGDLQDADGDQFLDASQDGGSDCDDTNADVFPGATEICDDGIDNDCDERLDKDDEECAGCSCEASISSADSGSRTSLLFALLIGAIASVRRRRN